MDPLSGGGPWPAGFEAGRRREREREREWLSYVHGAYKLNPQHRCMLAIVLIVAGSRHTANEIPQAYQDKVVWPPEKRH